VELVSGRHRQVADDASLQQTAGLEDLDWAPRRTPAVLRRMSDAGERLTVALVRATAVAWRPAHRVAASLMGRVSLAPAAAAAALSGLVEWLLGPGLENWFVALGMDSQRAALLTSMLVVALATAIATAAWRQPGPARLGGLLGFGAVQVVPFLITAAGTPTTPTLRAQVNVAGWILEPLAMLLLGGVSVVLAAALAMGLVRDVSRLGSLLVRRRRLWPAVPVALAGLVIVSGTVVGALQDGPLSGLHTYSANMPAVARSAATRIVGTIGRTRARPRITALRQDPGTVQTLSVAERTSLIYLPGAYGADPSLRVPVIYFLHGTPGNPGQWLGSGGQLQGVLDQMISSGVIPPLIAVMPNGNGVNGADTQWGNTPRAAIETWLVDQLVPAVDAQYRTLGAPYRGIAGLSSGGFGAVNLAVRNPGVFRWAASYSGYFSAPLWLFGASAQANSPQYTAPLLPAGQRMPLYLGYGTGDVTFRAATEQFAATLRASSWPQLDVLSVPGGHGWQAWSAELVQSLTWVGRLWGPTPWLAGRA
jgi:enterochelin esterase-like enzyme